MKKQTLFLASALILLFGLHSCLDYDTPLDNVKKTEMQLEDKVFQGKADSILYRVNVSSETGFNTMHDSLKAYFGQMISAQYAIRGGKQGNLPVSHAYQYQYTMNGDNYAGYSVLPHKFAEGTGGSVTSTYDLNLNYGPNGSYTEVRKFLTELLNHPLVDSIPEMKAAALLFFDFSTQETADVYGPVTYVDFKANKQNYPYTYDSLRAIYYGIVMNLDTINACFKHFQTKPEWYRTKVEGLVTSYIRVNKAPSIEKLRLLANSLKLRMAMHIVKIEPEKARKWAEEAVAEGVIATRDDEAALYPSVLGFTHPLVEVSESWSDSRLNASFESLLASLEHPYYTYLFRKNDGDLQNPTTGETLASNQKIVGIRAGTYVKAGQSFAVNPYIGYSRVNRRVLAQAPLFFIKLAEVQFLRAEGALREWEMGGTAEDFYYAGIDNASLEAPEVDFRYQNLVAAYKGVETAVAYQYKDPLDDANNIESVTKIGVKWNAADEKETKLEKIITQKYIALYPCPSYEAWTELRRTGYPKIFPVLNTDDGDGSLKAGDLIRRIPFPGSSDASVATDIQTSGLKALGGPDLQATRLWWDVETANF